MCERLLNLQKIYVSGQNICIEVYGNSVGTFTPACRTPACYGKQDKKTTTKNKKQKNKKKTKTKKQQQQQQQQKKKKNAGRSTELLILARSRYVILQIRVNFAENAQLLI